MKKVYYVISIFLLVVLAIACSNPDTESNNKPVTKATDNLDPTEETVAEKKEVPSSSEIKMTPQLKRGKKMFILCQACHSYKKGEPHKTGPNLNQIFGSHAASKADFKYSDALKTSEIVWDESHLKNWLTKPMDYIPGTSMAFIGIKDEKDQNALIAYLKEITK